MRERRGEEERDSSVAELHNEMEIKTRNLLPSSLLCICCCSVIVVERDPFAWCQLVRVCFSTFNPSCNGCVSVRSWANHHGGVSCLRLGMFVILLRLQCCLKHWKNFPSNSRRAQLPTALMVIYLNWAERRVSAHSMLEFVWSKIKREKSLKMKLLLSAFGCLVILQLLHARAILKFSSVEIFHRFFCYHSFFYRIDFSLSQFQFSMCWKVQ